MTGSGLSTTDVTARSADGPVTSVAALAESFAELVSVPESVATVAVFVMVPLVVELTCTSTTNRALAPGLSDPIVHVTSPDSCPHVQPAGAVTPR